MDRQRPSLKKDDKKLTVMQRRFVEAYTSFERDEEGDLTGAAFNATKAAILAGYSQRTARSIGHELKNKPHIRKAIDECMIEKLNCRFQIGKSNA